MTNNRFPLEDLEKRALELQDSKITGVITETTLTEEQEQYVTDFVNGTLPIPKNRKYGRILVFNNPYS